VKIIALGKGDLTMKPIDFGQVANSYAWSREDIPMNLISIESPCYDNRIESGKIFLKKV
jgi:hypothetical protein